MPLKCLDQLCQSPPAAQEKPSFLGLTSNKPGIYIFHKHSRWFICMCKFENMLSQRYIYKCFPFLNCLPQIMIFYNNSMITVTVMACIYWILTMCRYFSTYFPCIITHVILKIILWGRYHYKWGSCLREISHLSKLVGREQRCENSHLLCLSAGNGFHRSLLMASYCTVVFCYLWVACVPASWTLQDNLAVPHFASRDHMPFFHFQLKSPLWGCLDI